MIGKWVGCPVGFEREIFLEMKSKVSLIWALWAESYFISLSIFFCSFFLYLHSLFCFIWSFLYWLSADKCLVVGDTTPRLWLQTVLVLLGNFFFFFLYFLWYFHFSSVVSSVLSPHRRPPPPPPQKTVKWWNKILKAIVQSPSLEFFKTRLE